MITRSRPVTIALPDRKPDRSQHRVLNDEVLEIALYPELKFTRTRGWASLLRDSLYHANITGKLTLHGVTNEATFPPK